MTEQKPEKLEYVINPLDRNYGIIFPEGTDENSKIMLALEMEKARRMGKDIELGNGIKVVPLRPLEEDKPEEKEKKETTETTENNDKQDEQKTEQKTEQQTQEQKSEEKPTETQTEKVITNNPVNPENSTVETQTVQTKSEN